MLWFGIDFLFQVHVVQPDSELGKQDSASSQKPSKTKNPFAKKRREKMKEDKKKKMAGMDEKKQREYLEKELEDEILVSYSTQLYTNCVTICVDVIPPSTLMTNIVLHSSKLHLGF